MNSKVLIVALILSSLFALSGCSLVRHTIEHAPYTVVQEQDEIEVREYAQLLLVSAPMNPDSREDGAFRKLFRYISGDNSDEQDISMTAPVFMDPNETERMSFVLPSNFDLDNAPAPDDAAVTLSEVRDMKVAVIRFSGTLSEENIQENKAIVTAWIADNGFTVDGEPLIAGYDPPTSIPWFRRNEVLIPIR